MIKISIQFFGGKGGSGGKNGGGKGVGTSIGGSSRQSTEIQIAENRIKEAEKRRSQFAAEYEKTKKPLYRRMAESETKTIAEIREEIIKALLKK